MDTPSLPPHNKESFDRVLAHLLKSKSLQLSSAQTEHIAAMWRVLDGKQEDTPIHAPASTWHLLLKAIIATVMLVSQPNGNVMALFTTERECRAVLTTVLTLLEVFELPHPAAAASSEFGVTLVSVDKRERIQIRSMHGTLNAFCAYPQHATSNLRGVGERLVLVMVDASLTKDEEFLDLVPLLRNGACLVVTERR